MWEWAERILAVIGVIALCAGALVTALAYLRPRKPTNDSRSTCYVPDLDDLSPAGQVVAIVYGTSVVHGIRVFGANTLDEAVKHKLNKVYATAIKGGGNVDRIYLDAQVEICDHGLLTGHPFPGWPAHGSIPGTGPFSIYEQHTEHLLQFMKKNGDSLNQCEWAISLIRDIHGGD